MTDTQSDNPQAGHHRKDKLDGSGLISTTPDSTAPNALIERQQICTDCGHEKWEHKVEEKGHCDSGHPAVNKAGHIETYGSMDWCTCKKFILWPAPELAEALRTLQAENERLKRIAAKWRTTADEYAEQLTEAEAMLTVKPTAMEYADQAQRIQELEAENEAWEKCSNAQNEGLAELEAENEQLKILAEDLRKHRSGEVIAVTQHPLDITPPRAEG